MVVIGTTNRPDILDKAGSLRWRLSTFADSRLLHAPAGLDWGMELAGRVQVPSCSEVSEAPEIDDRSIGIYFTGARKGGDWRSWHWVGLGFRMCLLACMGRAVHIRIQLMEGGLDSQRTLQQRLCSSWRPACMPARLAGQAS